MVLLLSGTSQLTAQQESQYTQFMYNKLFFNPAYAGVRDVPTITAIYRRQWIGFDGAPASQLLNFNSPFLGKRVGLGISLSNHKIGIQQSRYINLAYSYNLQINETQAIRFGIQGSFRHLSMDFSDPDIIVRHSIDQSIVDGVKTGNAYGNFGFGLYYEYKNLHVGLSVPYFFRNEITLNNDVTLPLIAKLSRHYYLMTGLNVKTEGAFLIQPALLVKYVKNAPLDADFNIRVTYDHLFTFGLTYRTGGDGGGDSIDLLTLYQFNQLAVGLSYDFNLSTISKQSSGSFELVLRYDLAKSDAFLTNPRFFN